MSSIIIKTGTIQVEAELNQSRTAREVFESLPLKAAVNTWGEEVYFEIPVYVGLEDGKETVNAGDLGFWPTGNAFCIFFGPTPMSKGNEIRPASAVNVFGKITGDPGIFENVESGSIIEVLKKES